MEYFGFYSCNHSWNRLLKIFFFFFHLLKLKLTEGVWDMLSHSSKQCLLIKLSERKYLASLPKVKIPSSERISTVIWEARATKHLRYRYLNQFSWDSNIALCTGTLWYYLFIEWYWSDLIYSLRNHQLINSSHTSFILDLWISNKRVNGLNKQSVTSLGGYFSVFYLFFFLLGAGRLDLNS